MAPSSSIAHFALDPTIVQLNHGSFGACPREVLDAQARLRGAMEASPTRFYVRELPELLERSRAALAEFVEADRQDLVFVRNATQAVGAVLASARLAPGDELCTTSHAYGACKNALQHWAGRAGARVIVADVPFPIRGPEEVVAAVLDAVTERTRLVLLDHVTSPTALVLPIEPLIRELEARGVAVLVDGAHAPGMLPLALDSLGASYYTGNLHKWVCAPKGVGFLHVRRDRQSDLHPAVISHGYTSRRQRSRFLEEFDWVGTDDFTPALCLPAALECLPRIAGGTWDTVRRRNHELTLRARDLLCAALAMEAPAPDAMLGSMATLTLPFTGTPSRSAWDVDPLQLALYDEHRIEVPLFAWPTPETRQVRVSAQLYNQLEDYQGLARALAALRTPS